VLCTKQLSEDLDEAEALAPYVDTGAHGRGQGQVMIMPWSRLSCMAIRMIDCLLRVITPRGRSAASSSWSPQSGAASRGRHCHSTLPLSDDSFIAKCHCQMNVPPPGARHYEPEFRALRRHDAGARAVTLAMGRSVIQPPRRIFCMDNH
jgi:hypothetical protein